MVLVGLHILRTPEDAVVQTEHVEGGHSSDTRHDPTNHRTVLHAGGDNLILRTETREERNSRNGQTGEEEGDVRNRHILAQTTHQSHLIRVYCMDDTTGTQEQASLEHSVGEQMEHTSHITQLSVIIHDSTMMTGQRYTQCHHHKCNLRDGREGEHTLDIRLATIDMASGAY